MNKNLEKYKGTLGGFFRWVKGSELVELEDIDVTEDPVRPELDVEWRTSCGRKIYGLKYEGDIEGVVCVAYTIWSRKRGAGKELIHKLAEHIKTKPEVTNLVTLSPLTPMATHFHIRNGAKQIAINSTTQNFKYLLK